MDTEASEELTRYYEYYNAVLQWLVLKLKNKSIETYFMKHGYRKVAIYGMSDMGNCLYADLQGSKYVHILYAIDQGFPKLYHDVACYKLDELCGKEVPDAVVVMLPHICEDIEKHILQYISCDVVSITEVVYDTDIL